MQRWCLQLKDDLIVEVSVCFVYLHSCNNRCLALLDTDRAPHMD